VSVFSIDLNAASREALEATRHALSKALSAPTARESADWSLMAKNSASALHSLLGASNTARRS
jgi:hypothetical protein